MVAILMTLEGEYYVTLMALRLTRSIVVVAILMTLEGEYYQERALPSIDKTMSQSS